VETDDGPQMGSIARKDAPEYIERRSPQMKQETQNFNRSCGLVFLIGLSLVAVAACAPEEPAAPTEAPTEAPAEAPPQVTTGRSLGVATVPNLRDLGGYETDDGAALAKGMVYRSNQLSGISPEDMEKLAELGLKVDYDLRTSDEKDARPDELPPGVEYVWLDVLADSPQAGPAMLEKLMEDPEGANVVLGGGQAEAGFQESYREFVSLPSAKKEFSNLFLGLGDEGQLPALFHCTTGKDRTGWAAAALLTLLGVPKDVVMEDYLRSNDYIIPMYQKAIDGFVAAGGEESIPLAILGVKQEYLEAAFDEMETEYGTIEKYFADGLGIDVAQQQTLRDLYLVPK
jgi:protein-tyrosine phosphatase